MTTPITIEATDELDRLLPAALSLSLVTGTPFRLAVPGGGALPIRLRPSHLALMRTAGALCGVSAPAPSDAGLSFPGEGPGRPAQAGDYLLDVGAVVSAPAVLACLQPALALAGGGTLHLRGATHHPAGPLFHTLGLVWPVVLRAFGMECDLRLRRAGFAPEGSGELVATVRPPSGVAPDRVSLGSRGTLHEVSVTSLVAGPQLERAHRQSSGALAALRERGVACTTENRTLPASPPSGGAVLVRAQFEHTLAIFSAVGVGSESPERTGQRAAAALLDFLEGPGAVDDDTAQLLLLWGVLLAAQRLGPSRPGTTIVQAPASSPALRAIRVAAEAFLPVRVAISDDGLCTVSPAD